jgi:hypothetical protein
VNSLSVLFADFVPLIIFSILHLSAHFFFSFQDQENLVGPFPIALTGRLNIVLSVNIQHAGNEYIGVMEAIRSRYRLYKSIYSSFFQVSH